MSRQKRLDLLYWARSLKISYLWRCEEYGGLAQIAHGVELGPENKSFTISIVASLGIGCCVLGVSAIFYPSSKVYRDQPAAG